MSKKNSNKNNSKLKTISSRSNKPKKLAKLTVNWEHQLLSRITSSADHRLKETMRN